MRCFFRALRRKDDGTVPLVHFLRKPWMEGECRGWILLGEWEMGMPILD